MKYPDIIKSIAIFNFSCLLREDKIELYYLNCFIRWIKFLEEQTQLFIDWSWKIFNTNCKIFN
jgi:hypothetical protein